MNRFIIIYLIFFFAIFFELSSTSGYDVITEDSNANIATDSATINTKPCDPLIDSATASAKAALDTSCIKKDTLPRKFKVMLGTMDNNQLNLYLNDTLIQKAISEELSETLTISAMLIHKDFDEALFFYIEGKLGEKPLVLRIKLYRENETELYITQDSFLEYCLARKKCKIPAFADLVGCKCLSGNSKSVEYRKIENICPSDHGLGIIFTCQKAIE